MLQYNYELRKIFEVIKLYDYKKIQELALFFHKKWSVPLQKYIESMNDSLQSTTGVPAWYYVCDNGKIIAGAGVIENDFHKRKDLTPNICALYVTKDYRKNGIARLILEKICSDLSNNNIKDVYLITTHTNFYEKCGFEYYCDLLENDNNMVRCYYKKI